MKSFLEFVCCVPTPEASRNEEVVTASTASPREEIRSLVRKKKRVRVGTQGSMTPDWKPSLHMISEDNDMAEKREKARLGAPTADRVVKRKSTTGLRSKVHVRSYSDDIGRNSVQMAIPTFSPTPFMF